MTFVHLALSPSIPSSSPFQEKRTQDMAKLGFPFSWYIFSICRSSPLPWIWLLGNSRVCHTVKQKIFLKLRSLSLENWLSDARRVRTF